MALISESLGSVDDAVRLTLNDELVVVAESYEVRRTVFTQQPCSFTLRLGWGDVAKDLVAKVPPKTRFSLDVGAVVQFTGETDGFELDGSAGATELTVTGRDDLAPLHDAYIDGDETYSDITFLDLTKKCLDKVGVKDYKLFGSNEAHRKAVTGTTISSTSDPNATQNAQTLAKKEIRFKAGARRWESLKKEHDRAGIFLWSGANKEFYLTEPNANQDPLYRIIRQRGATRNAVNVTAARWKNDTAHRFSDCTIYTRVGSTKFGRSDATGSFVDAEMTSYGFTRPLSIREPKCAHREQAERLARRKIAEANRQAWTLNYTVTGHTIPCLQGVRAVWTPDTIVDVVDDEFGITDQLYLESVTFKRSSAGTTTDLVLMRKQDLVFGLAEFEQ